jgi:hypothetical protein
VLFRYDDFLRVIAEEIQQVGRVRGRHNLRLLTGRDPIAGVAQSIQRIPSLPQQTGVQAAVEILNA